MDFEQRLKFYEKLYLSEVDRGDKINARLNLPPAVCAALLGLLAFLFQNSPNLDGFWKYCFWAMFSISITSIIVAFVYFFLAWFGKKNSYIATAQTIDEHYHCLRKHYFNYPNAKKLADKEFKEFLFDSYKNYATTNAKNNDIKSENIARVALAVMIAIMTAMLTLLPFLLVPKIIDINQQKQEMIIMTSKQPPPPPPRPEPRNVRNNDQKPRPSDLPKPPAQR